MFIPAIPVTPNGKLDRKRLPKPDFNQGLEVHKAPVTETERILAEIFSDLLGLDSVSIQGNFFEMGGHSLSGARLISRVRERMGVPVRLKELFQNPTIARFGAMVDEMRTRKPDLPPLGPAPPEQPAQLSYAQQRLWFLERLEGHGSAYNLAYAVSMKGALNVSLLEKTFHFILKRHQVFGASFSERDGKPVLNMAECSQPPLTLINLEAETHPLQMLEHNMNEEANGTFRLDQAPLFRICLYKLQDYHVLQFTMHHIISDGWSLGVLVQEMGQVYSALFHGSEPKLEPLPVQYADYAWWQRSWLQGETLRRQRDYWVRALSGAPGLLELPTDRPRPARRRYKGARVLFALDQNLTGQLGQLANRCNATLFMVLQSALSVLLSRYANQDQVVIGSPMANRNNGGTESLIGFFVNTLALRTDLSGMPDFETLLARVRRASLEAYAHQDIPFEQVVDAVRPERSLSQSPLFQVALALQNVPFKNLELPELTLEPLRPTSVTAKFDQTWILVDGPCGLEGVVEYDTDLFNEATLCQYTEHFKQLLQGMVQDPTRCIYDYALMDQTELDMFVTDWNATAVAYPSQCSIQTLFQEQAELHPQAPAYIVTGEDGEDQALSYGQLNRQANRLSFRLRQLGVRRGHPVAVFADQSFQMLTAITAILKAGGFYVPLDPGYPADRLLWMLADSGARILLKQSNLDLETPNLTILDPDLEDLGEFPDHNPDTVNDGDDIAYVIYTSGSTGRPKGVMIPHRGVVRLVRNTNYVSIKPGDCLAQVSNISFDAATFEIWGALLNGARMAAIPRDQTLDPRTYVAALRRCNVDHTFVTAALFSRVTAQIPDGFKSLTTVIAGGDVVDPSAVLAVMAQDPAPKIVNGYGPTENTTFSVTGVLNNLSTNAWTCPIGRPVAQSQAYIVDPRLNPKPRGATGALMLGGDGLALGYLGRPALTADRFIPNPFASTPGSRLYQTGDLARYGDDGAIIFCGRLDFQVKLRGFRIEPGEIEAVLSRIPQVAEVIVLLREDRGDKKLVAYLRSQEGVELNVASLREELRLSLPDYMIPSAFVVLDRFPLNPNGKVDRKQLPLPGDVRVDVVHQPSTPVERKLARAWAQLLGLKELGVHDNFFEMGGHSLLAAQAISTVRSLFGVELSLRSFFEQPTVAQTAISIGEQGRVDHEPILPEPRGNGLDLSYSQQRLWFIDRLQPGGAAYNIPTALRLTGPLRLKALDRAVNLMTSRHESLRTTFSTVDGDVAQMVAGHLNIQIPYIDLMDVSHPGGLAEQLAQREATVRSTWKEGRFLGSLLSGNI